jgi:hypothetical protein
MVSHAPQPAVPRKSEQAIVRRAHALAYVPARVPSGFRYYAWRYSGGRIPALRIVFRNKAKWEIVFVASAGDGSCTGAGSQHSYQLGGNKVWWAQTDVGQQAWRCVRGANGKLVRLTAETTKPPTRFGPSGIGTVVAAGRRARA